MLKICCSSSPYHNKKSKFIKLTFCVLFVFTLASAEDADDGDDDDAGLAARKQPT